MLMSPQNIVQGPDDISSGVISFGGSYSGGCDPNTDPTCTPTTIQGGVTIQNQTATCPTGNCNQGVFGPQSNLPLLILIVAVAVVLLR